MKKTMYFTPVKALVALALATALCLTSAVAAFASGPIHGTETEPAKASLTKLLQMPEGTSTPAASFTFTLEKKSVDDKTSSADLTTMPTVPSQTVTYAPADTGTVAGGVKTVPKETGDLFATVTWPHAGVYVYTITETPDTYTIADATQESMSYSAAKYDVAVYVDNGTSGLYVRAIAATIVLLDDGSPNPNPNEKIDPTPGGDPQVTGDYSKMAFTNTYLKTNTGTNPTDSVLHISNTVEGAMSDQTKYFTYDLVVTKPATVTGTPSYRVYVLDAADNVVTSTDNYSGTIQPGGGNAYFEVTAGVSTQVRLKHGQRMSFIDLPVGASYQVTEAGELDYTPSVSVVANGAAAVNTTGSPNTALAAQINGGVTTILIGEAANTADYTNTYKTVTPTGIGLDDMPFMVLIVLAVAAVVAFVVVRYRKKAGAYGK